MVCCPYVCDLYDVMFLVSNINNFVDFVQPRLPLFLNVNVVLLNFLLSPLLQLFALVILLFLLLRIGNYSVRNMFVLRFRVRLLLSFHMSLSSLRM